MARYLAKRLLLAVPVAFAVSVAVFVLLRVAPGDVATAMLGPEGAADPQTVARIRASLGLDDPLIVQYVRWLGNLARLDAGESLAKGIPVVELLAPKLAVTLELAALAFLVGTGAALVLGVVAARSVGRWPDALARLAIVGGMAVPSFWLGILVVVGLARYTGYFPFLTYQSPLDDPWRNAQQLIFPALVLGWRQAAVTGRMVRAALLDTLQEDYVRTARAKGLSERAVLYRHALRNAALPSITVLGFQAAHLLGGAVVLEQVFNLPGLGRALVDAVLARDYPVVQLLVLFFALVTIAATLVVDLAYAWLDPRVRYA